MNNCNNIDKNLECFKHFWDEYISSWFCNPNIYKKGDVFLLGKCWSWNAKHAISQFVECGHQRDYSSSWKKSMKWWAKYILNKMS
jgi:hypothetical protein